MIDVREYGAVGDGAVDDSLAIQRAFAQGRLQHAAVYFPNGRYRIRSLSAQFGYTAIVGDGDATLVGSFVYREESFPPSADTMAPLAEESPYFSARGINFRSEPDSGEDAYALLVSAQVQDCFLLTATIADCRFYGTNGLNTQNLIGFTLDGCLFLNQRIGWKSEGCTNGTIIGSKWHNQASYGVLITSYSHDPKREGGENIRFSNCEWAVCLHGLYVERHNWLALSECLLDYCALPLCVVGSNNLNASATYFGAAGVPQARFGAAALTRGIAVYARPYGSSDELKIRTVGGSFVSCEFVNYTGNEQPAAYFEGSVAFSYGEAQWDDGRRADMIQFSNCLFLIIGDHQASTLLQISNASAVGVFGNRFYAEKNSCRTLKAAYRFHNCVSAKGAANDFFHCLDDAGATVGSPHEA